MLSDFHVHTTFSGDSNTPVKEQIERAILLGMKEICITDHHDYDVNSGEYDFNLDFDSYFTELTVLKETYRSQIALRIGIELGLQTHLQPYFTDLLKRYSFDFIIGSTHYIYGLDPYFPSFFEDRNESEVYRDFFLFTYQNLITYSNFDVLGHLDYIVRYGPTKNQHYCCADYWDILDLILTECINRQIGIECNSSGFRHGLSQPNPHPDILKRYRELGGEIITIGSDAHHPSDLSADFDRLPALLTACGYRYYTTFVNRRPHFHPLIR